MSKSPSIISTASVQTAVPETVTPEQAAAVRASIREAADRYPSGTNRSARCSELGRTLCHEFGVERIADLPARDFGRVLRRAACLDRFPRVLGPAEQELRLAGVDLDNAFRALHKVRASIAGYRHAVQDVLLSPMTSLLRPEGGVQAGVMRETVAFLLSAQLLDAEHALREVVERLAVLTRDMPILARAFDDGTELPAMLGAD